MEAEARFWPMCSGERRKLGKSASVTVPGSTMVREWIPARTRFLATSAPRARMVMRRIRALRIFSWALIPQRRICLS